MMDIWRLYAEARRRLMGESAVISISTRSGGEQEEDISVRVSGVTRNVLFALTVALSKSLATALVYSGLAGDADLGEWLDEYVAMFKDDALGEIENLKGDVARVRDTNAAS